ncbi:MAG: DUF2569 family protein [Candidatus Binatia bacterium]
MNKRFIAALILTTCFVQAAYGAEGNQTTSSPAGGGIIGALIMWFICNRRRTQEIGGWLLYYYIQLYVGVVLTVVITAISFDNYLPASWNDAPNLYPLFLLSTVPALLLLPIQLGVAEKLRKSRDYSWVHILRYVLWIDFAGAVVATFIDLNYFADNLTFDALALVWSLVWLPYFYVSKRVSRVFNTKDWLAPLPTAPEVA